MFKFPNTNIDKITLPLILEHDHKTIDRVTQSLLNSSLEIRIFTETKSFHKFADINYETVPLYKVELVWIYSNYSHFNRIQLSKIHFFRDTVCSIFILLQLLYGKHPHRDCFMNVHLHKLDNIFKDTLETKEKPFTGFTYNPIEEVPTLFQYTLHKDAYSYIHNFDQITYDYKDKYESFIFNAYNADSHHNIMNDTTEDIYNHIDTAIVTFHVPDIQPFKLLEKDVKLNIDSNIS